MPFIRGRYHMNPVLGEALEAAREAEAALLELEQEAQQNRDDSSVQDAGAKAPGRQPIHRVEIEAAELVPAHSGRAERGFVARVHRQPAGSAANDAASAGDDEDDFGAPAAHQFLAHNSSASRPARAASPPAETHVFSDHRDLLTFLRDELARDCKK